MLLLLVVCATETPTVCNTDVADATVRLLAGELLVMMVVARSGYYAYRIFMITAISCNIILVIALARIAI